MLRQIAVPASLLLGYASRAQGAYYPAQWVPFGQQDVGEGSTAALSDVFESSELFWRAQFRYPNLTSSVQVPSNGNLTWRVNITQSSVPPATTQDDEPITPDPHLMTSVFELLWANNEAPPATNDSTADNSTVSQCAFVFNTTNIPWNITEEYNSQSDGSCDGPLGAQCVQDFLAAVDSNDCQAQYQVPSSCADTLGTFGSDPGEDIYAMNADLYPTNTSSYSTYNDMSTPNVLRLHDAFNIFMSTAYPGTDNITSTAYENYLQILVLTGLRGEQDKVMMCQRLNFTPNVEDIVQTGGAIKMGGAAGVGTLMLGVVVAVAVMFGL